MARNNYFDFIRGVAIAMVIGIHTYGTATDIYSLSYFLRQILNAAVPLFLSLSGIFLAHKTFNTIREYKDFLGKQVAKVYLPVIFWSIPLFLLAVRSGSDLYTSLILLIVCGYSIYYFVALIVQFYILLPVLRLKPLINWILMLCITISSVVFLKYAVNADVPMITFAIPFLWISFFVQGIFLASIDREYNLRLLAALFIFFLFASIAESFYLRESNMLFTGIKPSTHLLSTIIIFILFSKKVESFYKSNAITRYVERLGGVSFFLYLIHYNLVPFFQKISGYWAVRFMLVLALSVMIFICLKKLTPVRIHKYLGL